MSTSARKKQVAIVIGTRPEIIKMAPVIEACKKQRVPFFIIHTNQHYSKELDSIFFKELSIPKPRYNLGIGSGTHGDQTGKMCSAIEAVLMREQPKAVLVHGDTNTTLAGALAAVKLHIPIVHIEAGLRSGDRKMPEEVNRILVDHMSDVLCVPSEEARSHLLHEGIPTSRIVMTGNTIVDAVDHFSKRALRMPTLKKLELESKKYILATLHRPETTDTAAVLTTALSGLVAVAKKHNYPVIMSLHPRTKHALQKHHIAVDPRIRLITPVGYLDFLCLEKNARLIMTDSGGIQEEGYLLRVPCVTVSGTTERPETLLGGGNILAGRTRSGISRAASAQLKKRSKWKNTFGHKGASKKVIREIQRRYL